MKKLIVLAAAICFSTAAFSQAQFSIGLKAGPNFANLDPQGSVGSNYNNRTGFHGGAFALLKFTKVGIQPEVLFSQQGSKFKLNDSDVEANYNYFNIPVMIKLYTIAGINLQVGPQFGFVAGGEKITTTAAGVKTTEDAKDVLKGSDISAALGVGWDLPFGLSIDGRYNLGLTKIASGSASSEESRNQVWQFSLGYKLFKFGKK
jgi:hypothetical protein